jgi:hypothetical protein
VLFNRHREFERAITTYADEIIRNATKPELAAECHIAKLSIASDDEKRFRSIQSLALLKEPVVVAPLIKELIRVSKTWPAASSNRRTRILLKMLNDLLPQIAAQPEDDDSDD